MLGNLLDLPGFDYNELDEIADRARAARAEAQRASSDDGAARRAAVPNGAGSARRRRACRRATCRSTPSIALVRARSAPLQADAAIACANRTPASVGMMDALIDCSLARDLAPGLAAGRLLRTCR